MTMQERLKVHADIERQNRENVKRYNIGTLHMTFVRRGQFDEAHMLLRLLRNGVLRMGLDDVSWNVQTALESIKHPVRYSHNGNSAYAYCERGRVA